MERHEAITRLEAIREELIRPNKARIYTREDMDEAVDALLDDAGPSVRLQVRAAKASTEAVDVIDAVLAAVKETAA